MVELSTLNPGDKFSFELTPDNVHKVLNHFGTSIVYLRPDGWLITARDLDRKVIKR